MEVRALSCQHKNGLWEIDHEGHGSGYHTQSRAASEKEKALEEGSVLMDILFWAWFVVLHGGVCGLVYLCSRTHSKLSELQVDLFYKKIQCEKIEADLNELHSYLQRDEEWERVAFVDALDQNDYALADVIVADFVVQLKSSEPEGVYKIVVAATRNMGEAYFVGTYKTCESSLRSCLQSRNVKGAVVSLYKKKCVT